MVSRAMSGTSSPFGAFLDSTMDRLGDGAVFGSLTAFAIFSMESSPSRTVSIVAGLITIVGAATVSYSRARAESIGVIAKVGIAGSGSGTVSSLLCWGAALYGWGTRSSLRSKFVLGCFCIDRHCYSARAFHSNASPSIPGGLMSGRALVWAFRIVPRLPFPS